VSQVKSEESPAKQEPEEGDAKRIEQESRINFLFISRNTLETVRSINPKLAEMVVKSNEKRADYITQKKAEQGDRIIGIKEKERGRKNAECQDRRIKGWVCMLIGIAFAIWGIQMLGIEGKELAGKAGVGVGLVFFVAPFARKAIEQIVEKLPWG
jgi:hypothetical protein